MTQDAQPSPDDAQRPDGSAAADPPPPSASPASPATRPAYPSAPPPPAAGRPAAPLPTWHADPAPALRSTPPPWPALQLAPVPPPPAEAVRAPRRVDPVPGTPFGVVQLDVPPVVSGTAIGSLLAGIGSILVALLVACFGLLGAQDGWGAWAGGAFAVLSGLTGVAAVLLGLIGRRQISRPAPPPAVRFTGRGYAVAGLSCGATGLGLTVLAFVVSLVATVA